MTTLFKIETDLLQLNWSEIRHKEPVALQSDSIHYGRLSIKKRRQDLRFGPDIYRSGVPVEISADIDQDLGPILYEQTDYRLFIHAKNGGVLKVSHIDPIIESKIEYEDAGNIAFGVINFGSQIGRTEFSIWVNGQPEIDFEVEVFPSKLDYFSDYQEILADVQDVFRGLVFEYLRATYQKVAKIRTPQPTDIEWLILLRSVVQELEKALHYIAQHPIRSLTREPIPMPVEKIRRVDASVRAAIRRQSGMGELITLKNGVPTKSYIEASQARPTLDTPEHRWLATQLHNIRRRIGRLRYQEIAVAKDKKISARVQKTLTELDIFETRFIQLTHLEPIDNAKGTPPAGFASIQLLSAPGYREAYQACLVLSLGLRIEGGPLRLSVKDLNQLYEYWCYVAILRIVAEVLEQPIPTSQLLSIQQKGLQILLQKGRQCSIPFNTQTGRKITLTYNPKFTGNDYLVPQQPDILMTFEEPNWPKLHLLFDAKYRVDASPLYQEQYDSPGPPEDALNVLHRYRDAILENNGLKSDSKQPNHSVVQAVALFPYRETVPDSFSQSRLWRSLNRLGVGAIPFLPNGTEYLFQWLSTILHQGGWALADRVIPHLAVDQIHNWRAAASEMVLVGPLKSGDETRHFDWISQEKTYYMPLLKQQRRQYITQWIALYMPLAIRQPGAVTCFAKVESIEIRDRQDISTPWQTNHEGLFIVYHLGGFQLLSRPIENKNEQGHGDRFSTHRWTSKLALDRASALNELFLETEPEWRLYEELQVNNIPFTLRPGDAKAVDPLDPKGRATFELHDRISIRYGGAAGFIVKKPSEREETCAQLNAVIAKVIAFQKADQNIGT